jgi:hypothetical protein
VAVHLRCRRVQPGADTQSRGGCPMSRYSFAARSVAHSGPPRWDATLSRMGFGGWCE